MELPEAISDMVKITMDCLEDARISGSIKLMHLATKMLPDKKLALVHKEILTTMKEEIIGKPGAEKVIKDIEKLFVTLNEIEEL